mmetsp:Transcript_70084/g.116388  ORF Transcript_70084/g.116388 Transcript_70084/m.116388 type:complete len:458 (-) Transcript_70084:169-1542(-)
MRISAATQQLSHSATRWQPAHSADECRLRIFVYSLNSTAWHHIWPKLTQPPLLPNTLIESKAAERFGLNPVTNVSCLHAQCQYDSFSSLSNIRAFTSEVPVYDGLLSKCTLVADPSRADILLVPIWFGTAKAIDWGNGVRRDSRSWQLRRWLHALSSHSHVMLPHLTRDTAHRHVFLASVDSQFLPLLRKKAGSSTERTGIGTEGMEHAIWIHLGDDHFSQGNSREDRSKSVRINSLVVPYRVSHWLPFGDAPMAQAKSFLLFANINMHKGYSRNELAQFLQRESERLRLTKRVVLRGSRHNVSSMQTVETAARYSLRSTFCLCPSGDSKGLTARFYFSVFHNCIPVRLDLWVRGMAFDDLALPFGHLIDWRKVMIDWPMKNPSRARGLLEFLAAMPQREIDARQRYIQKITHWLHFDIEDVHKENGRLDAVSAVISELELRLLALRFRAANVSDIS